MLRLIVLCLACTVLCLADESQAGLEPEPESAASNSHLFYPQHGLDRHDEHDDHEVRARDEHDLRDAYHVRHENNHHKYSYGAKATGDHKYQSKAQKIIEDVYSPDYHEPTLILDYRYLKSGGRKYVRGPGGQILILPKSAHGEVHEEHKNYHDYDSLIEYLRLRNLAKSRDDDNLGHNHHRHHEEPWY